MIDWIKWAPTIMNLVRIMRGLFFVCRVSFTKIMEFLSRVLFAFDSCALKMPNNSLNLHWLPKLDLANGSFGLDMGWVKLRSDRVRVKWHFGSFWFESGMVRLGSILGQLIFDQIRSSCQNEQLCEKFQVDYGSGPVNSSFGSTFGCQVGYGSGSLGSDFGSRVSFVRSIQN